MTPKELAAFPVHLRRACSCMSGDGGFRAWLDARFGEGKWMLGEYARGEIETAIGAHDHADLAIEYGHERLRDLFSSPSAKTGA